MYIRIWCLRDPILFLSFVFILCHSGRSMEWVTCYIRWAGEALSTLSGARSDAPLGCAQAHAVRIYFK